MTIQIESRACVRRAAISVLAVAAVAMSIGAVGADGSAEPISGLEITDAVVTPARKGGTAIVGFRIDNLSSRSVTLVGVRSEIAGSAAIVVGSAERVGEEATAILIDQNETLDLRSSHLRIELLELAVAIEPGDMVPFELVFADGMARAEAHAHAWTSRGDP